MVHWNMCSYFLKDERMLSFSLNYYIKNEHLRTVFKLWEKNIFKDDHNITQSTPFWGQIRATVQIMLWVFENIMQLIKFSHTAIEKDW